MLEDSDYALLSANVYATSKDVVSPDNAIPLPMGWSPIDGFDRNNQITGFLANVYTNGNDIVIAYAGTTDKSLDWAMGNVPAATGLTLAPQVTDAAKLYLDILAANPAANITFTGHSLGGGLASLMSVFFNRHATTFDEAPFEKSADSGRIVDALKAELVRSGYTLPAAFASYKAFDYFTGTFLPSPTRIARESNVSHIYLKDEILSLLQTPLGKIAATALGLSIGNGASALLTTSIANIVGSEQVIDAKATSGNGWGVSGVPLLNGQPIDLHYMPLLAAFLQSPELLMASQNNPEVLQKMFTSTLNFDQSTFDRNFINLMVQQQGNGSWAAFAGDISKLKGDVGSGAIKAAIVGLDVAMQYGQAMDHVNGAAAGAFEAVIQEVTGGIQIAPNPDHAQWFAGSLGEFRRELPNLYSDIGAAADKFPESADRYTLPTVSGMDVTAEEDGKFDLMVGSSNADNLAGADGNDVLLGRSGDDTLDGGSGWDTLVGGNGDDFLNGDTGYDRYFIDGNDTIEDQDGQGVLFDKAGQTIAGVIQKREDGSYTFLSDTTIGVTGGADLTLTLADGSSVKIRNFQDGDLGLQLNEEDDASAIDRTILGDLQPVDFDPAASGIQMRKDELDNIIVGATPEEGRSDYLQDSAGNDHIESKGGDDYIDAWRGGNDKIDGGAGDDIVIGRAGDDILIGGDGMDLLRSDEGKDKIYAGAEVTLEEAIAQQDAAGNGLKGDFVDGGDDDDVVVGDVGNDGLNGGQGDDILLGGGGDDDIDGDLETSRVAKLWSIVRSVITDADGTTNYHSNYLGAEFTVPMTGGDDVIYGGAGADWVRGGYGNDYVDGGTDDDVLFGNADSDDMFGGAGKDVIVGDGSDTPLAAQGDDYLDGEDGDDLLSGGGGSDQLFGGAGNDELYADAGLEGAGYDYLDGEDGDDKLVGGALDDELFGGAGADMLLGDGGGDSGDGDGNDTLDGEGGDDILLGEGGSDELYGGDGNDELAGDNGGQGTSGDADTMFGDAGDDFLDGQGGDDFMDGGADNDLIIGRLGNDVLLGGTGNDELQGSEGDDSLDGGEGLDILYGGNGDDMVFGGDGSDHLIGGAGNDTLDGGAGDDVYWYSVGDGADHIVDSGGMDYLVLNDITWGQVTLGTGSLKLTVPGGEIHLDDFDPDNPYGAGGIEYFQFAGGIVRSKAELINMLGIVPTGTPEADILSGTSLSETIRALAGDDVVTARAGSDTVHADDGADVVYGGDGNDIIYGGNGDDLLLGEAGNDTLRGEAGNDLLSGGAGTDLLEGGDGDDSYLFQTGDGADTAVDTLGMNSIVLGEGLTLDSIVFSRQADDLAVSIKNTTDRLTVKDWFAAGNHFAAVTLGDGTVLDHAAVEAAMPKNQAPLATVDNVSVSEDSLLYVTGNALGNDNDPEGRALRITNAGSYAGAVGALTLNANGAYSYSLSNSLAAVQALGAGQSLTERFAYTVTDDDPNGAATAESAIVVTVHGVNDLPMLGVDSASTIEDAAAVGGNVLANDRDVDAGTILTVANAGTLAGSYGSLTLASNGAWSYDLANATTAVQSLAAGQFVSDTFGINVSDGIVQVAGSLAIGITGRNDAPILVAALADQSASANSSWTWQLPVGSFTDIDAGDALSYGATLADGTALPSWLAFDAATQTFSGRVPKSATGSLDIRVGATDRLGAGVADVFTLSFDGSTGGGGGGGGGGNGGSLGNEGVGNGVDAAPPGHDESFNDGPGTQPGNPGAQGGNGYQPPQKTDRVVQVVELATAKLQHVGYSASSVPPGRQKKQADAARQTSGIGDEPADMAAGSGSPSSHGSQKDDGAGSSSSASPSADAGFWEAQPSVPALLNSSHWNEYYDSLAASVGGSNTSYVGRWIAMDLALSRALADGKSLSALDDAFAADVGGLSKASSGWLGTDVAFREDSFSLLAGNGKGLKTFEGLGQGTKQIV